MYSGGLAALEKVNNSNDLRILPGQHRHMVRAYAYARGGDRLKAPRIGGAMRPRRALAFSFFWRDARFSTATLAFFTATRDF
jgi:hypothetical protein